MVTTTFLCLAVAADREGHSQPTTTARIRSVVQFGRLRRTADQRRRWRRVLFVAGGL